MNRSIQRLGVGGYWAVGQSFHTSARNMDQVKKWKLRRVRDPVVDPSRLKFDKPVSGSLVFPEEMPEVNSRKFEFDVAALNQRGFLRFQKGYEAPPNAIEQLLSLARSMNPKLAVATDNDLVDFELSDPSFKYDFLCRAGQQFQHWVPNSLLYHVVTIRDAAKFYNTSVSINTPYDDLQRISNLPSNLHIQKEAVRFDPETDTMFGGISAFPRSSTIVTGLRAKKKYKTIHADRPFLDYK